jgi:hypothetical protein
MCSSLQIAAQCINNRVVPKDSLGKSLHRQRSNDLDESSDGVGKIEQLHAFYSAKNSTTETEEKVISIETLREGQDLASSKLPFLWKLHILLHDVEKTGDDHIISWLPHGQSFKVYRPKTFITRIAPHYFKQSKYKSFQRQLHLYEFTRTPYGPEAGSYSHPNFVRGSQSSCLSLSPIKIKGKNGRTKRTLVPPTSNQVASSPGKYIPQLVTTDACNITGASSAAAILPSKVQSEWVDKIKLMLVNGATLAAQLRQERGGGEEPNAEGLHKDGTCYAFGSAFHILPDNDHLSCWDCCASDDEDDDDAFDKGSSLGYNYGKPLQYR